MFIQNNLIVPNSKENRNDFNNYLVNIVLYIQSHFKCLFEYVLPLNTHSCCIVLTDQTKVSDIISFNTQKAFGPKDFVTSFSVFFAYFCIFP